VLVELEKAKKLFPLSINIRRAPGDVCVLLPCVPELGLRMIDNTLVHDPHSADLLLSRAKYLQQMGRQEESWAQLSDILRRWPNSQRIRASIVVQP
jgi:hypothetical protein